MRQIGVVSQALCHLSLNYVTPNYKSVPILAQSLPTCTEGVSAEVPGGPRRSFDTGKLSFFCTQFIPLTALPVVLCHIKYETMSQ